MGVRKRGHRLVRQLNRERSATRRDIPHANGPAVFGNDPVADAQAKTGSLADRLGCVERIENSGSVLHPGAAVGELDKQTVRIDPRADPQVALFRVFQDSVHGVVHHVEKNLLELMGFSGSDRQVFCKFQVYANVVHPQVVVAQREGLFEGLVDLDGNTFGFVLASEAQQVLHDAVGALRLFVKFVRIFHALLPHLSAGSEQLAVAENGGKRVIQFVRDSGNQLTNGRQLFAVEQLFLRAAQVFVRLARLFIENGALDGAGNLAAYGDEQVHVRRRELALCPAAYHQTANDSVFGPQDDDVGGKELFSCLGIAENLRKRQTLRGKKHGVHRADVLHQFRLHGNRRKITREFGTMSNRGDTAQLS